MSVSPTTEVRRERLGIGLLIGGSVAGLAGAAGLAVLGYGFLAAILLVLVVSVDLVLLAASWENALIAVLAAVLFVPADLYRLPSVLPFDVEPYRIFFLVYWSCGFWRTSRGLSCASEQRPWTPRCWGLR